MTQSTSSWLPTEAQITNFLERFKNSGYELRSSFFGFHFVGHGLEIYTGRAVEGLYAFVSREGERATADDVIVAKDRFSNATWFSDWTESIFQRADEIQGSQKTGG